MGTRGYAVFKRAATLLLLLTSDLWDPAAGHQLFFTIIAVSASPFLNSSFAFSDTSSALSSLYSTVFYSRPLRQEAHPSLQLP